MKKKIIAAVALLALAWAVIFGLSACGTKPAVKVEQKIEAPVKVERVPVPKAKPKVKHHTVHKAEPPKCTSSFLGIPTC